MRSRCSALSKTRPRQDFSMLWYGSDVKTGTTSPYPCFQSVFNSLVIKVASLSALGSVFQKLTFEFAVDAFSVVRLVRVTLEFCKQNTLNDFYCFISCQVFGRNIKLYHTVICWNWSACAQVTWSVYEYSSVVTFGGCNDDFLLVVSSSASEGRCRTDRSDSLRFLMSKPNVRH